MKNLTRTSRFCIVDNNNSTLVNNQYSNSQTNNSTTQQNFNTMKNIISTSRLALLTLTIALFSASFATAKGTNTKITNTAANLKTAVDYINVASFGITAQGNFNGSTYEIKNEKGYVIYKGNITSGKTFYVSAYSLGTGVSTLYINGAAVRRFVIEI